MTTIYADERKVGDYEYITATFENYRDAASVIPLPELHEEGWQKVWSDVTTSGAFVVFRRPRTS